MKFEREYLIGVEDVGKSNKITNLAYLKYLEEIACSHSATCGFGVNDIETKKKAWLLMDWKLKVIERPIYEKKLNIKTWARTISNNSFFSYRDFEVLYDFELNRITKLTNEIYGQYNPENIHVFENKEIDRIKEPINTNFEFDYMVRRSDIDINRHMHNLNYLKLAYEVLPENIYFGEELNNVRIMYKHQILFGENIRCYYSKEKEKNIIVMKSADNKVLHSIVQIS